MTSLDYSLQAGALGFDGTSTHVMAVINLSPESKNRDTFSASPSVTVEWATRHRDLGATIIDLGAQSSHFENPDLAPEVERERLLPHLASLVEAGFIVSVDTWKPEVAMAAIAAGAAIINDTGGTREGMLEAVAGTDVGLVAMYLEGDTPLTVGPATITPAKAVETRARLEEQLASIQGAGIRYPIIDPGIGISYRSDYDDYTRQQLDVIRGLPLLRSLGPPVLVPIPRKAEPARVASFMALSLEYGADIIRVHDVEMACDLVDLFGRRVG